MSWLAFVVAVVFVVVSIVAASEMNREDVAVAQREVLLDVLWSDEA